MSQPGNVAFLYDDAAVDVSRITGIPWAYQQVASRDKRRPCINLLELDWTDRMRVAFTVIAAEMFLAVYYGGNHGTTSVDGRLDTSDADRTGAQVGVLHA